MLSSALRMPSLFLAAASLSLAAPPSQGRAPRSLPGNLRGGGLSLAQTFSRWAKDAVPPGLALKSDELASYIATGSLPQTALAQLELPTANKTNSTEEDEFVKHAEKIIGDMKLYEAKLDDVRGKAEVAHKAVSEQEKRLTANFLPIKKMLEGLIQDAASVAAKAEVQTMLERLTRMHYKQVGTLDRSAAHWMEVAEREKEARRVAEARERLQLAAFNASVKRIDAEKQSIKEAVKLEKAHMEQWRNDYWAALEAAEKAAMQKKKPEAVAVPVVAGDVPKVSAVPTVVTVPAAQERPCEQQAAASLPETKAEMVPVVPGQYVVRPGA